MQQEIMDWTSELIAGNRNEIEPAEYIEVDDVPAPASGYQKTDLVKYLTAVF